MALYPSGEELDEFPNRFVLVNLAAKRATQLTRDVAPPLVETESTHPVTIALEEIAVGAVIPATEEDLPKPEKVETLATLELGKGPAAGIEAALGDMSVFLGVNDKKPGERSLSDLSSLEGALVDEPVPEVDESLSLTLPQVKTEEAAEEKSEEAPAEGEAPAASDSATKD
ncbi:MAG: DNA-directed RNA polymerase subunit omega [Armatimonadetes bacterium]|nr:DNA-directed RNA polymerase subunit omega [Armatimonadota bacterium]